MAKRTNEQFVNDTEAYADKISAALDFSAGDQAAKKVALLCFTASVCAQVSPEIGILLVDQANRLMRALQLIGFESDDETIKVVTGVFLQEGPDGFKKQLEDNVEQFKAGVGLNLKENKDPSHEALTEMFDIARDAGATLETEGMIPMEVREEL